MHNLSSSPPQVWLAPLTIFIKLHHCPRGWLRFDVEGAHGRISTPSLARSPPTILMTRGTFGFGQFGSDDVVINFDLSKIPQRRQQWARCHGWARCQPHTRHAGATLAAWHVPRGPSWPPLASCTLTEAATTCSHVGHHDDFGQPGFAAKLKWIRGMILGNGHGWD